MIEKLVNGKKQRATEVRINIVREQEESTTV